MAEGLHAAPLGKQSNTPEVYDAGLLYPVPRAIGRKLLKLEDKQAEELPFLGEDVWNCYEASWLDKNGWPNRVILEVRISCYTPNLVESKSLKLYLNSLNFHRFESSEVAIATICADLHKTVGGAEPPSVTILSVEPALLTPKAWICVDDCFGLDTELAFDCDDSVLSTQMPTSDGPNVVTERLVSHLLRTLCPVTGQPDWGSVLLEYRGPAIDRASLCRYVCSLRKETGFHENCVELLFLAILRRCEPEALRVTGRFLRRGGIDINPVRCTPNHESLELGCLGPAAEQIRVAGQ